MFFSLRIPVYKEIQLPNQFSRSLSRSWLQNSWLLLSFFLRGVGRWRKRKLPWLVNSAPSANNDKAGAGPLGVTRCGVAAELWSTKSCPQTHVPCSPTFYSVPRVLGCLLLSPFILTPGTECPRPPPLDHIYSLLKPPPGLPGKGVGVGGLSPGEREEGTGLKQEEERPREGWRQLEQGDSC